MAKQKLLSEQGRLAERDCAEMVLLLVSASKGTKPSQSHSQEHASLFRRVSSGL